MGVVVCFAATRMSARARLVSTSVREMIEIGDSGFGNVPSEPVDSETWQYQDELVRSKDFTSALASALSDAYPGVALHIPSTTATLSPGSRDREPAVAASPGGGPDFF